MLARLTVHLKALALIALVSVGADGAGAQIPVLADQVTFVDFDSLGTDPGTVLPSGVRAAVYPDARAMGTYFSAQSVLPYRAGSFMPPDAPAGLYNFGSGDSTSARDRAPGFLLDNNGVKTAVLYLQFVNQTGAPLGSVTRYWRSESYRRGDGVNGTANESRLVAFLSRDGFIFTSTGEMSQFQLDSTGLGQDDPPSGTGGAGSSGLLFSSPVPAGGLFYMAFQYSVDVGSDVLGTAAVALDNISIAPSGVRRILFVPDRLERVFSERAVGSERDSMRLALRWFRYPPALSDPLPDVTTEITGPAALDFEVREVSAGPLGNNYYVYFSPSAVGHRSAVLTFRAQGVPRRRVVLEGTGIVPNSTEEPGVHMALRLAGPYPNPATSTTRLELTPARSGAVSLFVADALGRVVIRQPVGLLTAGQEHVIPVDLRGLPAGVYLIRVESEAGSVVRSVAVLP